MTRTLGWVGRLAIVGLVIGGAIVTATSPVGPSGLGFIPYAGIGALLVMRRPQTSIGWILLGLGSCYALLSVPVSARAEQFADGTVGLPVALFAIVHSGLGTTAFFLYAVLAMEFPSGRLPTGRWGRLGRAGLGAGLVTAATAYVLPVIYVGFPASEQVRNPAALFPELGIWRVITPATVPFPIIVLVIAGAVSLGVRVRRARGAERQQLLWFAASAAVLTSAVVGGLVISYLVPVSEGLAWIPAILAFPSVPVAVGIAVMRYRLYEIDLIINRALVYGVLGVLVAAAYLVLAIGLGRLAGGEGSPATATLATVMAALVALAARQAVQRAINHLLYGRRGDPLAVIGSVARRLESAGTPEGLLSDVVGDLREALKLDAVAVYAVDGALLAGTARPDEGPRLSLSHQGELIGELRVWTARGDELSPGDLRLLQDDLGPQLAVAIEAVRLKRDLQRARERLVAALEDERRRLRHDLHDGLGPTLTAITLRADAATNLLARDPVRARELLDELRGAAGDAIAEVRRLTHGLRPMALDELGLVGAIREQGIGSDRAGMPGPEVQIDDGIELPPLPAAVEVAAYRIATEAITNAIRHAGAKHCRVRIVANTALEVEVTDDGRGWDGRLTPGVGIQSMRERAADLGGTLTIEPVPGGGTSVLARLPLATGSAS
jgi:signal transduction histidine kinase